MEPEVKERFEKLEGKMDYTNEKFDELITTLREFLAENSLGAYFKELAKVKEDISLLTSRIVKIDSKLSSFEEGNNKKSSFSILKNLLP